jgi:hypothetical protein
MLDLRVIYIWQEVGCELAHNPVMGSAGKLKQAGKLEHS